ncbi:MAG: ABC transporter ATP-binding protein [Chloroflexota bacterium]|nr:ABC transporter ATP-binding protein [Chloroflexota bacterium]
MTPGPLAGPIIETKDLTVRFGTGSDAIEAVRHASVYVNANEAVGVVGESGSGKTTLARAIVDLVRPAEGEILLGGVPVVRAGSGKGFPRADRWKVQMVFQDPYSSLNPRQRAWESVAEAIQVWQRVRARDARVQAFELLRSVGITEDQASRFPRALSGGQRQRVSVARALAPRPLALIADEPTSAIDQSAQAHLLNLLRRIQKERGLAVLFISHDLGLIRYLTSRVYVMKAGDVVESGPTERVFQQPEHPYTRLLLSSVPGRRVVRRSAAVLP